MSFDSILSTLHGGRTGDLSRALVDEMIAVVNAAAAGDRTRVQSAVVALETHLRSVDEEEGAYDALTEAHEQIHDAFDLRAGDLLAWVDAAHAVGSKLGIGSYDEHDPEGWRAAVLGKLSDPS